MQNYRKRKRNLQYEDLLHNQQFSQSDVGQQKKDIIESDCIDPALVVEDIRYYLQYHKIRASNSAVFHMTQIFEKNNRYSVLQAADTEWKTKNEYLLSLDINKYYGKHGSANLLFKETQTKYEINYKDTKEFFDSLHKLPSVTVKKGNYKTQKSTIISYNGFENDPFFKDKSINTYRRVSMCAVFLYIQEDRIYLLREPEHKNYVSLKYGSGDIEKNDVSNDPRFHNTFVDMKKINKRMRKNMSKTGYNFFVYERVFNKIGKITGGRIYSRFTFMSHKLREVVLKSCELVAVDMTASQMNLLYTSSFRKNEPKFDFDFYTFFLDKIGIDKKYQSHLRGFAKLACSVVLNAHERDRPTLLKSYLANEGLLYTQEELNNYKKVVADVTDEYKRLDISGSVYKDKRVTDIKTANCNSRKSRLTALTPINGKISQYKLVHYCYELLKFIIQYFNKYNIEAYSDNISTVESNSMIEFSLRKSFCLSIHDEFIVEDTSDIESDKKEFHKILKNECLRYSKGKLTFNYESDEIIEVKFNKIVIKQNSYLPKYRYIIMQPVRRLAFQT